MSDRARRTLVVVAVLLVVGAIGLGSVLVTPPSPSASSVPSSSPAATAITGATGSPDAGSSSPTAGSGSPTAPAGPVVAWTHLSPVAVGPVARRGATWTVDPSTGIAYLYGGTTSATGQGGDTLGDLWAYDLAGDTWEPVVGTSDEPPPRSGHVAAWVEDVGLVIVGGAGSDGKPLGDVWRFDPATGRWSRIVVTGATPPARTDACGAAPGDGTFWLSHGTNGRSLFGTTWKLDLSTRRWTEMTRNDRPTARSGAACWVDPGGRFIVSGGDRDGTPLGDLWALSVGDAAADWSRLAGGGFPPRSGAAVAIHLDRAVLVGGMGAEGALNDTGVMGATDDSIKPLAAADTPPPARSGAVLVDDPAGERMLLFGGATRDRVLDDLWSADLP